MFSKEKGRWEKGGLCARCFEKRLSRVLQPSGPLKLWQRVSASVNKESGSTVEGLVKELIEQLNACFKRPKVFAFQETPGCFLRCMFLYMCVF